MDVPAGVTQEEGQLIYVRIQSNKSKKGRVVVRYHTLANL